MSTYRLHYLADSDDMSDKAYFSETLLSIGDILQLGCGFYYMVIDIKQQKTEFRLDLSKSAQPA
ncbi:hypothetical protein R50076_03780 [Gilvimarinus japonicus]